MTALGSWLCLDWLENRPPGWAMWALPGLRGQQQADELGLVRAGLPWAVCADRGAQGLQCGCSGLSLGGPVRVGQA